MIWIVGDRGMLGSELKRELGKSELEFVGSDKDVDFLNPTAIDWFALKNKVTAIVNCAAYTAVDKAEDESVLCARLNINGPENLAVLANRIGARFIHISTDYVFDGTSNVPYKEDDPVRPLGTYGRTKAEGEDRVMAACPSATIVRTAWLYGEFGPNFVYTMIKLMRTKDEIGVVADQLGSPTWAQDLARAIIVILCSSAHHSGIYHFTNGGETSWYEFACDIYALGRKYGIIQKECKIIPFSTEQYPTKTKRPSYSVLSKVKIIAELKAKVPLWGESLAHFLEEVSNNKETLIARI